MCPMTRVLQPAFALPSLQDQGQRASLVVVILTPAFHVGASVRETLRDGISCEPATRTTDVFHGELGQNPVAAVSRDNRFACFSTQDRRLPLARQAARTRTSQPPIFPSDVPGFRPASALRAVAISAVYLPVGRPQGRLEQRRLGSSALSRAAARADADGDGICLRRARLHVDLLMSLRM